MKRLLLAGGVLALTAPFIPSASASVQVGQAVTVPVHADIDATAVQCDNHGSTVDISGTLSLGGLQVYVAFKNNVKGTHSLETLSDATVSVVPAGGSVSVPKQPAFGGVGGNPWLSFAFTDAQGGLLTQPVIIGRCVQGLSLQHVAADLGLGGNASALASALSCDQHGSTVNFDAGRSNAGLNGLLLMDNNKNKVVHQAQAAAALTISLLGSQSFHKGWGQGGAGGNPLVYMQFRDDQGAALGQEYALGRCNKIGG
jgi:hypothetical protein